MQEMNRAAQGSNCEETLFICLAASHRFLALYHELSLLDDKINARDITFWCNLAF